MPLLLFSLLLSLFCLPALGQEKGYYQNNSFIRKEIKDSGFKAVYALRYHYDYNYPSEYIDSFYMAFFDGEGRLIKEKTHLGIGDSTVYHYSYINLNSTRIIRDQFSRGKHYMRWIMHYDSGGKVIAWGLLSGKKKEAEKPVLDTFYYDNKNRLIKIRKTDGSTEEFTDYTYDKKGKLLKVESFIDESTCYIWNYYYNEIDSVSRKSEIEINGKRIDSVIYYYAYDNQRRLIEKSRRPSDTYYKTYKIDCTTGDYYCYQFAYDSQNRIVYEADRTHEIRGSNLFYASAIDSYTYYTDNGYVTQSYDLKGKPGVKSYYTKYEGWDPITGHYLKESSNHKDTITMYSSSESYLIKRIDQSSPGGIQMTIIYSYHK